MRKEKHFKDKKQETEEKKHKEKFRKTEKKDK